MALSMAATLPANRSRSTSAQVGNSIMASAALAYPSRVAPSNSNPRPAPDREEFARASAELLDLVRHLSGPDGCPWDRAQTARTLSPYLVEEAHEIGEAIAHEDRPASREELGDLFF